MPSDFIQSRIDRLLVQAADAADELDWDQAIKFAEAVLAVDEGNADANAFLQMAAVAAGTEPTPSSPTNLSI